jgi:hypothetical protein
VRLLPSQTSGIPFNRVRKVVQGKAENSPFANYSITFALR